MDRSAPDELDIRQRIGRLIQPQIDAGVLMAEQKLPPVMIIAVYYIDPWFSEVCQTKKQPQFNFFEITRFDDVLPHLLLKRVGKHLVLHAEFRRQKRVDK